jgi:tetratricopeptide (TPR) repeat protein
MARGGIIERIFAGEEGDTGEAESHDLTLDPAGASAAMQLAGSDADLAHDAAAYFRKQAHLVEIQTEHLHEQREVQLSHLKLRRFTDRLKAGTQLFIVLAATVICLGAVTMLCDAFTSHSVVVEGFKAPSTLAGRGVTGDVVASDVLDGLQKLQIATRGTQKSLNTRGAWTSDIKIEVPETGVSIGEVDRLLHKRFGHDVHIDGDLTQTDTGGLALTVRGDDVPASTFTGAAGDLDKLTTQAAEYIYGWSQPIQYAVYLAAAGRDKEALAFLPGAYARTDDDADRARLANSWGNAYVDLDQPAPAAEKYRLTMSLAQLRSRYWWTAWSNLIQVVNASRGEEFGWRASTAFLKAAAAAPKPQQPELRLMSAAAGDTWDLPLDLAGNLADLSLHSGGAGTVIDGPIIADGYTLMHDPVLAARYIAASNPDDPTAKAESFALQAYAALDQGDPTGAVAAMEAYKTLWLANPPLQIGNADEPCFLGLAYGLAGRMTDAEAAFKLVTLPWSRCYAFHGEVLAHAGDLVGAQRMWAEGVRLLPDLPNVYLARGRWEMKRGDLKAAGSDLSAASAKAPHYADPWKAWGDLLAREGRWKEAASKYDEALKSAPAWAELHQARDAAERRT